MKKSDNTRREFLKAMGWGAASLAAGGCTGNFNWLEGEKNRRRPNIIFIMADDHAAHALSCYGSKINQTPNLDRIAHEGVRFDNCFCTNGICAPSRAVILTGKYSHLNGHIDNTKTFDGSQQTFPKILQKAGYQTALIGKWHLKSDPQGFDYWNILPGQGDYYNPDFIEMGTNTKYHGYVTDIITDLCLDWLKDRRPDQPFCLMYHHKAPHRSWIPALRHLSLYDDCDIPLPENFFDDYATRSDAARQQEMTVAHHLLLHNDLKVSPLPDEKSTDQKWWLENYNRMDEQQKKLWDAYYGPRNEAFRRTTFTPQELAKFKYQRYLKDYLRCIAAVDENVGRLLDYLNQTHLAENTVVVYTSDQGFYLGDHGWFDKRFMYEESLRMPFIVRWPKMTKPGRVSREMVMNLDFAPTFLDLAGLSVPRDMQGRSLQPILRGKHPGDWRTAVYYHYYEYPGWHMVKRHYGIRTQRYKLIHFYYDIDAWELYDLQQDPYELNNLYHNPAYGDIVKKLKSQLQLLRKEYGDSDELTQKYLDEYLRQRREKPTIHQ